MGFKIGASTVAFISCTVRMFILTLQLMKNIN